MNGPITEFIKHHYRHFNAAALVDAAKGYKQHLDSGGKMMIARRGDVDGVLVADMRQYLEFIADQRLAMLGIPKVYRGKNPFSFMELQDVSGTYQLLRTPRLGLSSLGRRRGQLQRGF